jgi:hypothetical protein
MTIEKLIKYCIQYLELDAESDVTRLTMDELAENSTFSEYVNNIENSIYMGLTRYSSSNVLPVKLLELARGIYNVDLVEEKTLVKKHPNGDIVYDYNNAPVNITKVKPIANKIVDVFATDEEDNIITNIEYYVIGDKVRIKKPNANLRYSVIYHPKINELEFYLEGSNSNIYDIELNDLGVTDEMAINLKYFVYSDLKLEENATVANINKNYFETYLESLKMNKVAFNQNEMTNRANYDSCSDDAVTYGREWRDVYGD